MSLFEQTKVIVPPEGRTDNKIAIVGEAPGLREHEERRPWVGPAGSLLMEILAQVGIARVSCYLTNVVKERPPNNQISKFITFSRTGKVNKTEMFDYYVQDLKTELMTTKANVIVAAGNIPLYALCGFSPPAITKRRGSIYESTLLPGRKVIPIIHPSSCLHRGKDGGGNYLWRHLIFMDLIRTVEQSEYPELRFKERNLRLFPAPFEAISYLKECMELERVGIDIEVRNEQVSHFGIAKSENDAMSIVFYADGKNIYSERDELEILSYLSQLMYNKNITKIVQNALFDIPYIWRKYNIDTRGPVYDTMVGQAFLYPDFPKGLDFQVSMLTDVPYYKDEGKKHLKAVSDEKEFAGYNAKDTIVLPEIMDKQIEDMKVHNLYKPTMKHMDLVYPLSFMAERGIKINVKALNEEKKKAEETLGNYEEEFKSLVGYNINMSSSKQLMQYFYGIKGLKPYISRSSGNPTLDANALQRMIRRDGLKEAEILSEWRKLNKLKTTYYEMKIDSDGRMRCSWNSVGTRYTRLSSSENIHGTGGNLQNQPHSMLRFFEADSDYLIFSFDLSQADWRVVAYLSKDENMLEALETGDIHKVTAGFIFDKEPNEISNVDGSADFGNGTQSERYWGKKANHAFNYGQTAGAFALQMLIPEKESRLIQDKYFSGYPGIKNTFWKGIEESLRTTRTIVDLFGRPYTFMDRYSQTLLNEAYSYIPQSTVAWIINQWGLLYLWNNWQTAGVELLLQVHDSLVFQIPKSAIFSKGHHVIRGLKSSLESELTYDFQDFSIPCEGTVGFNLGKYHQEKNPNGQRDIDFTKDIQMQLTGLKEKHETGKAL